MRLRTSRIQDTHILLNWVDEFIMARGHSSQIGHLRQPELTNAYLIGGGIASLAAAVHLVHDACVPPSQVHILESA
jgi:myosin-crossreactive antigen